MPLADGGSADAADETAGAPPAGSLVVAFHQSEAAADSWAAKDPYARAGLFASSERLRFNELDCSGRHELMDFPMADQPDRVMARMVREGLFEPPRREVERVVVLDDGALERIIVPTNDPRLPSNVLPSPIHSDLGIETDY